jgi:hypothetical protein
MERMDDESHRVGVRRKATSKQMERRAFRRPHVAAIPRSESLSLLPLLSVSEFVPYRSANGAALSGWKCDARLSVGHVLSRNSEKASNIVGPARIPSHLGAYGIGCAFAVATRWAGLQNT